jgi:tetratricopeptide (TPR) repeat protein
VYCSSGARFRQSYEGIARALQLPGADRPETKVVQTVADWLRNEDNGRWLLILDNADDSAVFQENVAAESGQECLLDYVPQSSHGSVLITSRNRQAALDLTDDEESIIDVEPMTLPEAVKLLRSKLPRDKSDDNDVAMLAKELGCLPLAIKQAAAYISVGGTRMTISKYLEYFRKNETYQTQLLLKGYKDLRTDQGLANSIILSWQISFDQIKKQLPAAADLLSLMSTVDRHEIPIQLMQPSYDYDWKFPPQGGEDDEGREATALPRDDLALEEALACLENFSLISAEIEDQSYSMHRLVQLATQCWLETHGERMRWRDRALKILYQKFPEESGDDWTVSRALYPHAQIVTAYEFSGRRSMGRLAITLTSVGNYDSEQGRYDLALVKFSRAVEIWKELGVSDSLDLFTAIHGQAVVLRRMGKYHEAERQSLIALEGREKELGISDPATLETVSNLAAIYRSQGKYKEAEELYKRALQETEIRDNELTLMDATNLALIQNTNEYDAAVRLGQTVLEERKAELGLEHPKTLAAMNDLAEAFRAQGNYEGAVRMHMATLDKRQLIFGPTHPLTLNSTSHAGEAMLMQNKLDDAVTLHTRVLEGRGTVLGPNHPLTLDSISNLASALNGTGKSREAEALFRKALKEKEKVLGSEHPRTLDAISDLASILARGKKFGEADSLYRRAIQGRKKVLGLGHRDTWLVVIKLAEVRAKEGDMAEAETLYCEVIDNGLPASLGESYLYSAVRDLLDVLERQHKFSDALGVASTHYEARRQNGHEFSYPDESLIKRRVGYLKQMNEFQEAERVLRSAFEECERSCGVGNYHTKETFRNLVEFLKQQKKFSEIETLCSARYRSCLTACGVYDVSSWLAFNDLMGCLRECGKDEEIAPHYRERVEAMRNTPASDSRQFFVTFGGLMDLPQQQGNVQLLETLHRQRYEYCKQAWGPNDIYTRQSLESVVTFLAKQGKVEEAKALREREEKVKSSIRCDGCGLWVDDDQCHYHCGVCNDGNFDLCRGCFDKGTTCDGGRSHSLVKRVVKEGRFVSDV